MDAVVIMAKAPLPDKVKTRLTPPLEPGVASSLYRSFLLDKIEQVRTIRAIHPFLSYTPEKEKDFFRNILPHGFELIQQVGEDLGEKLSNISKSLFHAGFKKVVILDSDTPNLPPGLIKEGIEGLDKFDVILGPCEDGGYYLIGMREHFPELFNGIPWSTSEVTRITLEKARNIGLSVSKLESWYDVDTGADLLRLKKDLGSSSGKGFFCKNTLRTISGINFM